MSQSPRDARLVVRDVTKTYPTRAEALEVLRGVSLALAGGENLAILGPSGSGKSTLLRILGALDAPSSGSIALDGQNPAELSEPLLAHFRNQKIGFVFQDHCLLPQCSVLENVLLPTMAEGATRPDRVDYARSLLERVGLGGRLDHRPTEISGGERQRAAIARAMINGPSLLLADEPTGDLDRTNASRIGELLLETQSAVGAAMIVVTHSVELAALFQRRMVLDQGKLEPAP